MSLIFNRRRRGVFRRLIANVGAAHFRFKEAREAKKVAIHPSFLDDFGA